MRECLADKVRRVDVRFPIYPHQRLVTRVLCGVVKLTAFGCRFRQAAAAVAWRAADRKFLHLFFCRSAIITDRVS
jgi:hypothetical protein